MSLREEFRSEQASDVSAHGLRYTVESLLGLLAAGMTIDELLADYPDLQRDDVLAALEFGARAAGRRRGAPLPVA